MKIKIVILTVLLSVGSWADSMALFGKVINVSENDILNVRSQSNYRSKKVGELPPNAYVGIEKCKMVKSSTWCRVYQLVQNYYSDNFHPGWVNARYLKFSDRGYVIVQGTRNCAYALSCNNGRCEVVLDFETNNDHGVSKLHTEWIERSLLKGESNFGVTPENEDGYCNSRIFIDDYLKKYPNYLNNIK